MFKTFQLVLFACVVLTFGSCSKKSDDPAASGKEFLSCKINGTAFSSTPITKYYPGGLTLGKNALQIQCIEDNQNFTIELTGFQKAPVAFKMDDNSGKVAYVITKPSKLQFNTVPKSSTDDNVTITNVSGNVIEGTFKFTAGTAQAFTEGSFRTTFVTMN